MKKSKKMVKLAISLSNSSRNRDFIPGIVVLPSLCGDCESFSVHYFGDKEYQQDYLVQEKCSQELQSQQ